MSARAAIAIVSWNTRDLLERCLESVAPDVESGLAEAWVVDNGSSDGSPEMVRDRFEWANLIEAEKNLGFGPAVNLVASQTSTPWVAPANADIELERGTLALLIETGESWPRAGAVAPRLTLPDGSTQHSVFAFPTLALALVFNSGLPGWLPGLGDRLCIEGSWDQSRLRTVDWAVGAFLIVDRAAWDAVGGFDDSQWMYAEDLDLGWRLARAGYATVFEPAASARHRSGASTEQVWGPDPSARWLVSSYGWMLERRGVVITRLVALTNVLGAAARWIAFALAARLGARRYLERADRMRRWARLHAVGLASRDALLERR